MSDRLIVNEPRLAYRLRESRNDAPPSLYAFVIADRSYIQIGVYLDRETDAPTVHTVLSSAARG